MCGFVGYVTSKPEIKVDDRHRTDMLASIVKRGPDSQGEWRSSDARIWMGHRRLGVVELSDAGHQPMLSSCGRFVLVFNGEIYNHAELRSAITQSGGVPESGWTGYSDTETLLAAIRLWGVETALIRTVGMFALAVLDKRENSLTLGRDRLGEKPLYYGWNGQTLLFGSTLKALRAHPDFDNSLNWSAAALFLRLNYVPAPYSIYSSTSKLPPGTTVTFSSEDLQRRVSPSPRPYWSLQEVNALAKRSVFPGSYLEAVDELDRLITQAVRIQSIADVPLGAFLSGGIDSSLVVAKMMQNSTGGVNTFTIGMPEERYDESTHANNVAAYLGTAHQRHVIDPHEALELIPNLSETWDEPFGDSSSIPTYLLCKMARHCVTVTLSGDGGDELFLGYPRYRFYRNIWRLRVLGRLPWTVLFGKQFGNSTQDLHRSFLRRPSNLVRGWRQKDAQEFVRYWFDPYKMSASPIRLKSDFPPFKIPNQTDPAESAALWDLSSYLTDGLLVKLDRASMAHGLEARAPFLDHRIVEFALSLPTNFKLSRGTGKRILRDLLYRHVPRELVDRPKMGFSIPLGSWMRRELRPWAESMVDSLPADDPNFDREFVQRMWQDHMARKIDNSDRLWSVFMLGSFLK